MQYKEVVTFLLKNKSTIVELNSRQENLENLSEMLRLNAERYSIENGDVLFYNFCTFIFFKREKF